MTLRANIPSTEDTFLLSSMEEQHQTLEELKYSFSFNTNPEVLEDSFSFNSYVGFFSDDDDNDDDNDDESFIEIALEPKPTSVTDCYGDDTNRVELRVSISPHVQEKFENDGEAVVEEERVETAPCSEFRRRRRRLNIPAANRVLNMLLGRRSEQVSGEENLVTRWDFARNREVSNAKISTNHGVMKFFMKLRANVGSLLVSSLRSSQQGSAKTDSSGGNIGNMSRRLMKPFEKKKKRENHRNNSENGRKSRAFEINLDAAVRGVIEAVSVGRKAQSCPTSTRSSPIRVSESKMFARDNSIQSAIAHCKSSFAQTTTHSCS